MKNTLRTIILCTSMICYSADDNNRPNHIIGVAGTTDSNYAVRRGFIDGNGTYACAIAHTIDSSLNKDILQQMAHEIFEKQIKSEASPMKLARITSNENVKLPPQFDLSLISLIITKEKLHHTIAHLKQSPDGTNIRCPAPIVYDLQEKTSQTFKIGNAGLVQIASSTDYYYALNNNDDIAKQIAQDNAGLAGELIAITRTPLDLQDMCTIS